MFILKVCGLTFIFNCMFFFAQGQNLHHKIHDLELEINRQEAVLDSLNDFGDELKLEYISSNLERVGWPVSDNLVKHTAFVLDYNEQHEQANWVMHMILTDVAQGRTSRTNDFREDSLVITGTSIETDYFLKEVQQDGTIEYDGFGFDRGHLAPSADFRWNQQALSETYFYSNISPQRPSFNREAWAKLENHLRDYVIDNNVELYVITGPVLSDDLEKIERSKNGVSIPKQFFKVVYDAENKRGIAFLMPNSAIDDPLEKYVMSIDELEDLIQLDFFPNLTEKEVKSVEALVDASAWLPGYEGRGVAMIRPEELGKGEHNTIQAYDFLGTKKKVTICGTVVSTFKSKKQNVFLNFDKKYPNTIFTATIWSRNGANFSYAPEEVLLNQRICVRGLVEKGQTGLNMSLTDEKQVTLFDEGQP